MLLDVQNLFSDDQNLAQVAGTYLSTNSLDLGLPGTIPAAFQAVGSMYKNAAEQDFMAIMVQVTTTFTSGGAATLQVNLISDDAAALGSPTILHSTPAIALATLVAGYRFRIGIPPRIAEQYLGIQYVIGTATTTAGNVTAGLLFDRQGNYAM